VAPVPDGAPRSGPLLLLDGMSLAFRAYFALPPDLATSDGRVTNAVHGFLGMLINLVRDHHPAGLAVAFDLPTPTFRDELVEGYKAGRAETPDDLIAQFEMIRVLLGALAVPVVEAEGYEADDVLATLATEARDRGHDVIVVTGDRDCFQLVEDPHVRVLYNRRGVSDYSLYDESGIVQRTGVEPARYPMLAAMRGDPSDNLPGVPGVGEKTAAKLLAAHGDLDAIFSHLADLTPKLRQNLAEHEAQVRANARVIPLVRTVPLDTGVADLDLGGWHGDEVHRRFQELELRTLWRRVAVLLRDGSMGPPAPGSSLPDDADLEAPPVAAPVVPVDLARPDGASATAAALGALAGAPTAWAPRAHGALGRSPLVGVAVVPVATPERGVWVHGEVIADPAVRAALAGCSDGLVGHDVKELLRTTLPMGLDMPGLDLDLAVAAYLLDSSSGDYGLEPVLRRWAPPPSPPEPGAGGAGREGAGEDGAPVPVPPGQLALGAGAPEGDLVPAAGQEAARIASAAAPVRQELEVQGLMELYRTVERPLVRVLARMEVTGIRVDRPELRRIADELASEAASLEAEVQRLAGHELNVNSTPQLRALLYGELGLTPQRKTKTGYSTDAATLERLRDQHPVVGALLRYREIEKLRSTYGESLLAEVGPDGRIHATFRQTVARTGRLSSEHPNLHNIPVRTEIGRRFRRAFVPEDGWRLLVADYDQIELRVLAHLSGDPGLADAFQSGTDVHRTVAAGVFGVPPEEVTSAQRERAKMVSYGLAYGMEAYGLARRLGSSVEEATQIISSYFRAFPEVRAYMDRTVEEARARGCTRTPLGRIRPLPELSDPSYRVRQAAERQAMNAGIQGLAADLFKTALVRLDGTLTGEGLTSRLVLQVHDEVLVEVAPGEDERAAVLTRQALTGAADLSIPLEVSMSTGTSWAAAKGG